MAGRYAHNDLFQAKPHIPEYEPIGVDLTSDVVDLLDNDDGCNHIDWEDKESDVATPSIMFPDDLKFNQNRSLMQKQSHPSRFRASSNVRKTDKNATKKTKLREKRITRDANTSDNETHTAQTIRGPQHLSSPFMNQGNNDRNGTGTAEEVSVSGKEVKRATSRQQHSQRNAQQQSLLKNDKADIKTRSSDQYTGSRQQDTQKARMQQMMSKKQETKVQPNHNNHIEGSTQLSKMQDTVLKRKSEMKARLERAKRMRELAEETLAFCCERQRQFLALQSQINNNLNMYVGGSERSVDTHFDSRYDYRDTSSHAPIYPDSMQRYDTYPYANNLEPRNFDINGHEIQQDNQINFNTNGDLHRQSSGDKTSSNVRNAMGPGEPVSVFLSGTTGNMDPRQTWFPSAGCDDRNHGHGLYPPFNNNENFNPRFKSNDRFRNTYHLSPQYEDPSNSSKGNDINSEMTGAAQELDEFGRSIRRRALLLAKRNVSALSGVGDEIEVDNRQVLHSKPHDFSPQGADEWNHRNRSDVPHVQPPCDNGLGSTYFEAFESAKPPPAGSVSNEEFYDEGTLMTPQFESTGIQWPTSSFGKFDQYASVERLNEEQCRSDNVNSVEKCVFSGSTRSNEKNELLQGDIVFTRNKEQDNSRILTISTSHPGNNSSRLPVQQFPVVANSAGPTFSAKVGKVGVDLTATNDHQISKVRCKDRSVHRKKIKSELSPRIPKPARGLPKITRKTLLSCDTTVQMKENNSDCVDRRKNKNLMNHTLDHSDSTSSPRSQQLSNSLQPLRQSDHQYNLVGTPENEVQIVQESTIPFGHDHSGNSSIVYTCYTSDRNVAFGTRVSKSVSDQDVSVSAQRNYVQERYESSTQKLQLPDPPDDSSVSFAINDHAKIPEENSNKACMNEVECYNSNGAEILDFDVSIHVGSSKSGVSETRNSNESDMGNRLPKQEHEANTSSRVCLAVSAEAISDHDSKPPCEAAYMLDWHPVSERVTEVQSSPSADANDRMVLYQEVDVQSRIAAPDPPGVDTSFDIVDLSRSPEPEASSECYNSKDLDVSIHVDNCISSVSETQNSNDRDMGNHLLKQEDEANTPSLGCLAVSAAAIIDLHSENRCEAAYMSGSHPLGERLSEVQVSKSAEANNRVVLVKEVDVQSSITAPDPPGVDINFDVVDLSHSPEPETSMMGEAEVLPVKCSMPSPPGMRSCDLVVEVDDVSIRVDKVNRSNVGLEPPEDFPEAINDDTLSNKRKGTAFEKDSYTQKVRVTNKMKLLVKKSRIVSGSIQTDFQSSKEKTETLEHTQMCMHPEKVTNEVLSQRKTDGVSVNQTPRQQRFDHPPHPRAQVKSSLQQHSLLKTPSPLIPLLCQICGKGEYDVSFGNDKRQQPILRFLPDLSAAKAAPAVRSFTKHICVHIFCGKTASFIPTIARTDLEISTTAAVKSRYGQDPEVISALAKTRRAILSQEEMKETDYFLLREFYAHLAALRRTGLIGHQTKKHQPHIKKASTVHQMTRNESNKKESAISSKHVGTEVDQATRQQQASAVPPYNAHASSSLHRQQSNVTSAAQSKCEVCRQGEKFKNGQLRPFLRFLPVKSHFSCSNDTQVLRSCNKLVCLHIFCGKSASVLPKVSRPDLEISTRFGIRNKYGISSEVDTALARTRSAALEQYGAKGKDYFIVREFEAHLAAIRDIKGTKEPVRPLTKVQTPIKKDVSVSGKLSTDSNGATPIDEVPNKSHASKIRDTLLKHKQEVIGRTAACKKRKEESFQRNQRGMDDPAKQFFLETGDGTVEVIDINKPSATATAVHKENHSHIQESKRQASCSYDKKNFVAPKDMFAAPKNPSKVSANVGRVDAGESEKRRCSAVNGGENTDSSDNQNHETRKTGTESKPKNAEVKAITEEITQPDCPVIAKSRSATKAHEILAGTDKKHKDFTKRRCLSHQDNIDTTLDSALGQQTKITLQPNCEKPAQDKASLSQHDTKKDDHNYSTSERTFILIDDSSDEDADRAKNNSHSAPNRSGTKLTSADKIKSQEVNVSKPSAFSESAREKSRLFQSRKQAKENHGPKNSKQKQAKCNTTTSRPRLKNDFYFYNLTEEKAMELQEQMLRDAAEKFRAQTQVHIVEGTSSQIPTISSPLHDIADQYPDHWTWKDPYACLGLPPKSSAKIAKSHYRKLARIYHPDKAGLKHSTEKFHAISKAYQKITNTDS